MLNLQKGEKLDLNKQTNKTLKNIRLGAGWDLAEGKTVDLDLMLMPKGGELLYYGNKSIPGASLDGDDLTGAGSADGADENILIDVEKLVNEEYLVVVHIYNAKQKGQFFKDVSRAFIEIEDVEGKTKIAEFNLTEAGGDNYTLIAGTLTKKDGGLHFEAKGEFNTKEIDVLAKEAGVSNA